MPNLFVIPLTDSTYCGSWSTMWSLAGSIEPVWVKRFFSIDDHMVGSFVYKNITPIYRTRTNLRLECLFVYKTTRQFPRDAFLLPSAAHMRSISATPAAVTVMLPPSFRFFASSPCMRYSAFLRLVVPYYLIAAFMLYGALLPPSSCRCIAYRYLGLVKPFLPGPTLLPTCHDYFFGLVNNARPMFGYGLHIM